MYIVLLWHSNMKKNITNYIIYYFFYIITLLIFVYHNIHRHILYSSIEMSQLIYHYYIEYLYSYILMYYKIHISVFACGSMRSPNGSSSFM